MVVVVYFYFSLPLLVTIGHLELDIAKFLDCFLVYILVLLFNFICGTLEIQIVMKVQNNCLYMKVLLSHYTLHELFLLEHFGKKRKRKKRTYFLEILRNWKNFQEQKCLAGSNIKWLYFKKKVIIHIIIV